MANEPLLRLYDGYTHTTPDMREWVRKAQELLRIPEPDGLFGRGTEEAVLEFQRRNGLDDDGVIGPITWAVLHGHLAPQFGTYHPKTDADLLASYAAFSKMLDVAELGAKTAGVDIAIIFGMAHRESRWMRCLRADNTGDCAPRKPNKYRPGKMPPDGMCFGRGLMQIDYDSHEFARTGNWKDVEANMIYGADVLAGFIAYFRRPTMLGRYDAFADKVRLGIAAYNCGPGNVDRAITRGYDLDFYTTGRDYSREVLSFAGWLKRHEGK